MGITSQILGNAGSPYRLTYNGKTYGVRFIDQFVKDAWEKRYFERESRKLEILKGSIAPEDYAARRANLEHDLDRDEFSILSPRSLELLQTLSGVQLLLPLLIGCDFDELIPLVVAKKDEVVSLVNRVIRESFPGVAEPERSVPAEGAGPN